MTEPATIPAKPYIPLDSPKSLVSIPFEPKRIISPIPCDIDGMSIGSSISTPNSPFSFTPVLVTHHAAAPPTAIEMTVAAEETRSEFSAAVRIPLSETSAGKSAFPRFTSIAASGQMTETAKKQTSRMTVPLPNTFLLSDEFTVKPHLRHRMNFERELIFALRLSMTKLFT